LATGAVTSIGQRGRTSIISVAATVFAAVLSVVVLLGLAALVSCGLPVTQPPTSARPEVVLDAYLRTLVAGDCATGRQQTLDRTFAAHPLVVSDWVRKSLAGPRRTPARRQARQPASHPKGAMALSLEVGGRSR
jgi:hypothetical protein